jgi:hypothetical protein
VYELILQMDLIRKLSVTLFGSDSAYSTAAGGIAPASPSTTP